MKIEGKFGPQIIVFSEILPHNTFKDLRPLSAGFIRLAKEHGDEEPVYRCYGNSDGLGLSSDTAADSELATRQILGRLGYKYVAPAD